VLAPLLIDIIDVIAIARFTLFFGNRLLPFGACAAAKTYHEKSKRDHNYHPAEFVFHIFLVPESTGYPAGSYRIRKPSLTDVQRLQCRIARMPARTRPTSEQLINLIDNLSDQNLVLARLPRYASKGLFSIAPKERYFENLSGCTSLLDAIVGMQAVVCGTTAGIMKSTTPSSRGTDLERSQAGRDPQFTASR